MPSILRIAEVSVYSVLNLLPHMLLAIYPFKNTLRFKKSLTLYLVGVITLLQILIGNLSAFSTLPNSFLSISSTLTYFIFYFIAVKAHLGKRLFVLLFLSNMANFVTMAAKCIEGLIFGAETAYMDYNYTYSLCMVIVHLCTTLPLFFYIKKYVTPVMDSHYNHNKGFWGYVWLIPLTFYLFWFHHTYGGDTSAIDIALDYHHTVYLLVIDLGSLLIYHMVMNMMLFQEKTIILEQKNQQLALNNLQYEYLSEKINEARHAKHDIRHHITVMESYLKANDYNKLEQYLASYKKSMPDDTTIVFCKNTVVNALLLYFAQQAKNNDIDFDVVIADIPDVINISASDLSVVMGNLIENAIEACLNVVDRKRKITIRIKEQDGFMFFMVENTYSGELKKDGNGFYLSSKSQSDKRGLGLRSVRNIIKKYDGILEIQHNNGIFSVSVFSGIKQENQSETL